MRAGRLRLWASYARALRDPRGLAFRSGPAAVCLALALVPAVLAQGARDLPDSTNVVSVTPGAHYRAGGLHRLLFGAHYRALWTTPLQVPVLDLTREAGGLVAVARGGGFQTRSLRFRAGDGREFAFRSLDKDPTVLLPEELKGTVAGDILRDQTSAAHPAGALVVPRLLQAAGVPHSTPRLVLLPDHPALGQYRGEFAGLLGILEERPGTDEESTIVPGAAKVISSDKLFARVEESADDRVDARALLAARLMDVFLGDWDRHRDQWRWATFDSVRPRRWLPIPRDRDQAFVRFDGLLLAVARGQAPQLVNFGPEYASMVGATWNGRELDRRFLVELERPVWDSVAGALRTLLTDQAIEEAVAGLPAELRRADSARLAATLKARRDRLPGAAVEFYRLLQGEVDLHATDEADVVVVQALDQRTLQVALYRRAGFDEMESLPYTERRLDRRETGEVRLYLHGGDDRVVVRGANTAGITLRAIGGGGNDELVDSTAARSARFYDSEGVAFRSNGAWLDRRDYRLPPRSVPTALPPRDWGHRTLPLLWGSAAPDQGLLLGGGLQWTDYGFRQQPYASRHLLRAGYATGASEGKVEYRGEFRGENRSAYLTLLARASGIETIRFNGFGNETRLAGSSSFYRVRQIDLRLEPALVAPLGARLTLSAGPTFRYSNTKGGDRYIDQVRPYGSDHFGMIGGRMELVFDSRDVPANARRGALLTLGGAAFPSVWDVRSTFGELHGGAATYLSTTALPLSPVLALRAGGKLVLGDYPYAEAAYIGDPGTVRLGRNNRFGGDAAVWGNAELRLFVGRYRIVAPGQWGILGLGDLGRVFLEDESSSIWHGAWGGGLWFGFLGRANTISAVWAQSAERGRFYLQAGLAY